MDAITISFYKFYTRCRFVRQDLSTDWQNVFYTMSNQCGVNIFIGYCKIDDMIIPVRFLTDDKDCEILTKAN